MTETVTLRYLLFPMATYGDDLGRDSGQTADAANGRARDPRGGAGSTGLPAPIVPPPFLPAAPTPGVPTRTAALPAPDRAATASTAMGAPVASSTLPGSAHPSMNVAAPGVPAPNSFTDIRAVHEATTQQLRERRVSASTGPRGRSVAVACAVVVVGGIAVVLGAVLL